MAIRVLGISGSPHRHGNTETLLDSFLEGAHGAGASVEKVVIADLKYTSCRGCNACHKTGTCVLKDDFIALFEKIAAADCLAIASPIYSMGITAELKALIDRAQYLWAQKFIVKTLSYSPGHMKRHKGVFLSTAGLPRKDVFDYAFPTIRAFFNGVGFEYYDNILYNSMDASGGIQKHPTALVTARERGAAVVKDLETLFAASPE